MVMAKKKIKSGESVDILHLNWIRNVTTVQNEEEPYVQLIWSVLKSEFLHVLERNPSGAVHTSLLLGSYISVYSLI